MTSKASAKDCMGLGSWFLVFLLGRVSNEEFSLHSSPHICQQISTVWVRLCAVLPTALSFAPVAFWG